MTKILVIDDEQATLSMFGFFLNAYGYTVYVAETGEAGIEILKKEKPSIVFTDIKMPGMDGFEVLKETKKIEPATEVIIMTGHGDMDLAVQALNFEATDFINKPIQRNTLESALKRAEDRIKKSDVSSEQITLRYLEPVTIIDIHGNITSHTEASLMGKYKKITEKGADKILIHFNETSSVNGAGIAVLIQLLTESKKREQDIAITGISENFTKIFKMVGITKLADIYDNEDDAIKNL